MEVAPHRSSSLQERLRKQRMEKQSQEPIRARIPGCGAEWETDDGKTHSGWLVGRYLPLKYEAVRDITRATLGKDDALSEITAAAELLVAAADGIEAVEDGSATDVGVKMGRTLAEYVGVELDDIDGDVQAVIALFGDNDLDLMAHHAEVIRKMGLVDEKILSDILGNSGAAS